MSSGATSDPAQSERDASSPLHFKAAPIAEAIIVISIPELPLSAVTRFRQGEDELRELGYGRQGAVTNHQFHFNVVEGVRSVHQQGADQGIRCFSNDGRFAAQFLRSGYIFSQIGLYDSWEVFTSEAKRLWSKYLSFVGNVQLQSFNVRYINKLYIPENRVIEDFLKVYVALPPELPQMIGGQVLKIVLPLAERRGSCTHQQIFLPPEKEGFLGILLDNDFLLSAADIGPDRLWSEIDGVRHLKDEYFVRMLTEEMKGMLNA